MEAPTLDVPVVLRSSEKFYPSQLPSDMPVPEKMWKIDASSFDDKIAAMSGLEKYLEGRIGADVAEDLHMAAYELIENAMFHQFHGEKGRNMNIESHACKNLAWIVISYEGERVPIERMLQYSSMDTLTKDTRHRGTTLIERCTDFTFFMHYSNGMNQFYISRINDKS